MNNTNRTEMVKQIKQAFKKAPFPGRKIGDKEELQDFLDKPLREVTVEDVNRNPSLLFFNNAGLLYYVQAYLIHAVEHSDSVRWSVEYSLLRDLGYERMSVNLCEIFDRKQKQVILAFFQNYETLFPIPLRDDFSEKERNHAKSKIDERHHRLEAAINYWKSCL